MHCPFFKDIIDFAANGKEARLIREYIFVNPKKIPAIIITYATIVKIGKILVAWLFPSNITSVRRPFARSASKSGKELTNNTVAERLPTMTPTYNAAGSISGDWT